ECPTAHGASTLPCGVQALKILLISEQASVNPALALTRTIGATGFQIFYADRVRSAGVDGS
ncbi:MAG: hypothetical protein V4772_12475, partial [Pseudomonadota bacterium]